MRIVRFFLFLLLFPALLIAGSLPPPQAEVRAIWVTRFDYKAPSEVESIIANCARAGFTDIFFQVRGNGTVFYPSRIEPWAFELSGTSATATGRNPGWDPLRTASLAAQRAGIRLHAYINVLPGWRGRETPPPSAGQLWTAHPDWFMVDSTGRRMQAPSRWYAFVNPAHPDVRRHLMRLAGELANYRLAGLHLDYIRFPYDYKDVAGEIYPGASAAQLKRHADFSYDPVSTAMARRRFGRNITGAEWNQFRRAAVSQVVLDLQRVFKVRRGEQAVVSASVLADFKAGYHRAFQHSTAWAKEGWVDWLVPMNYTPALYDERLETMRRLLGRRRTGRQLVMGIDCQAALPEIRRQIDAARRAGCRGVALFAYSYLFEGHRPTAKAAVFAR